MFVILSMQNALNGTSAFLENWQYQQFIALDMSNMWKSLRCFPSYRKEPWTTRFFSWWLTMAIWICGIIAIDVEIYRSIPMLWSSAWIPSPSMLAICFRLMARCWRLRATLFCTLPLEAVLLIPPPSRASRQPYSDRKCGGRLPLSSRCCNWDSLSSMSMPTWFFWRTPFPIWRGSPTIA